MLALTATKYLNIFLKLGGWFKNSKASNDSYSGLDLSVYVNKPQSILWDSPLEVTSIFISSYLSALQRQKTKISKQIFPKKEYWGLSPPNFHIHASMSDLYIPTVGLPILLEEICRPILGLYKSLTDTWMWKLGLRLRYSQKRNTWVGFSLLCGLPACCCCPSSVRWYRWGQGRWWCCCSQLRCYQQQQQQKG